LGLTQTDVGLSLGTLFGSILSRSSIASFEHMKLSHGAMIERRHLIEKWLIAMEGVNKESKQEEKKSYKATLGNIYSSF